MVEKEEVEVAIEEVTEEETEDMENMIVIVITIVMKEIEGNGVVTMDMAVEEEEVDETVMTKISGYSRLTVGKRRVCNNTENRSEGCGR